VLILLNRDGGVVGTLPYDEAPDTVLVEDTVYEYEATTGEDHIYREVE